MNDIEIIAFVLAHQPGTTRLVPDKCGHCQTTLNHATGCPGTAPHQGALSICLSCAGVNIFDQNLRLAPIPDKLLPRLYSPVEVARIERWRRHIREVKAIPASLRGRP